MIGLYSAIGMYTNLYLEKDYEMKYGEEVM